MTLKDLALMKKSQSNRNDGYIPSNSIEPAKRGRGRLKSSRNNPKVNRFDVQFKELTEIDAPNFNNDFNDYLMLEENENYVTAKKQADLVISHDVRKEGIITIPGEPFETSDKAEFQSLIGNGVIMIEIFDQV